MSYSTESLQDLGFTASEIAEYKAFQVLEDPSPFKREWLSYAIGSVLCEKEKYTGTDVVDWKEKVYRKVYDLQMALYNPVLDFLELNLDLWDLGKNQFHVRYNNAELYTSKMNDLESYAENNSYLLFQMTLKQGNFEALIIDVILPISTPGLIDFIKREIDTMYRTTNEKHYSYLSAVFSALMEKLVKEHNKELIQYLIDEIKKADCTDLFRRKSYGNTKIQFQRTKKSETLQLFGSDIFREYYKDIHDFNISLTGLTCMSMCINCVQHMVVLPHSDNVSVNVIGYLND